MGFEAPSKALGVRPGAVVVAGSINLDLVGHAPSIPAPGQTVLGGELQRFHGGKGANQAVAAARLGAKVRMFGAVGQDAAGHELIEGLAREGVATAGIQRVSGASGTALITVSAAGENAITVLPGANRLAPLPEGGDFRGAALLVLQLEIPLPVNLAWAQAAKAWGVPVLLNAAPMDTQAANLLLPHLDVLVVNEGELQALAGSPNLSELPASLQAVAALGPASVVATLGERGSLVFSERRFVAQPGRSVKVLDTTGAGDTFVGALAGELAKGTALHQALPWANAAAALACTQAGARGGMPGPAQVLALLASP